MEKVPNYINAFFAQSPLPIAILDKDMRYLKASKVWLDVYGLETNNYIGHSLTDLFPDLPPEWRHLCQQALNEKTSVRRKGLLQRPDGKKVWQEWAVQSWRKDSGATAGIIIYSQHCAPTLTEANATGTEVDAGLEDYVQQRTRQLKEENQEIRNFAYIVSHDLRVPLVNVLGFASEIRHSLADLKGLLYPHLKNLPEETQKEVGFLLDKDLLESIGYISRAGKRMNQLTESVLKLSRIGNQPRNLESLRLAEIMEDTLVHFKHRLDKIEASIVIDRLPMYRADRSMLEQVFSNLIDNAIKYRSPERPLKLRISCNESPAGLTLDFQDNGRGIEKKDFEAIFQVFRRSGKNDMKGEGMGLAYAKRLMDRLGGDINVHSDYGKGSVFSLVFPEQEKSH